MQNKTNLWQSLYDRLASLKLTIVILLLTAASSLMGTLLPQGLSSEQLEAQYGERLARWIDFFQFDDLYHSSWFRFLLLFLCLNLIVCTLRRLPKTIKLLRHQEQDLDPGKLTKFSHHSCLESKLPWAEFVKRTEQVIAGEFAPLRPLVATEGYAAVAEKGSWSRLTVYLVHLSVLVILVGALLGSLFGFKGFVNITVGDTVAEARQVRDDRVIPLPFQVRCDQFDVSFYDTGAPMEFRSDLTLLENGREVLKGSLLVNDPMSYKGVTLYQSSYGSRLTRAVVDFTERDSGKTLRVALPFRVPVALPGTSHQVEVFEFRENFHGFGPALAMGILAEGQQPTGSWILAKVPDFHGNRIQDYQVQVIELEQTAYTGLQVNRDPGIWVVYIGFSLLLLGAGVTFYTSHRKVWVWAAAREPRNVLHLAARTNKNSLAFDRDFDRLRDRLLEELQAQKRN
jgi:cytochrome c biogenesis protein